MTTDKELLKAVAAWVDRKGRNKAMALLVDRGVGHSTAQRLVNKKYASRPSNLLRTTLTELVSASPEEERAS